MNAKVCETKRVNVRVRMKAGRGREAKKLLKRRFNDANKIPFVQTVPSVGFSRGRQWRAKPILKAYSIEGMNNN